VELRDYLKVLRRRWRLIATVLLVIVAAISVLTLRATPQYQSKSRIFISTSDASATQAYQGGNFAIQRVSSYADLVNGHELASRVAKRLQLAMSPNDLTQKISAAVVPDTVILEISATDPSARRAQRIAQATAQELSGFVSELETPPGRKHAPVKATIVDPASLPTTPVSPQPVRNIGLAVLVGLLLGVAAAFVRELLDTSIKGSEDIGEVTEVPVLGRIQFDSGVSKQPLLSDLTSTSPRVEAFRILRTNLQFVDVDRDKKIFVVTSPMPREGKTSTASNTAIAVQSAGLRTLLIDGDLRRPQLADLFGLEPSVGLTSILLGEIDLEEAVQHHPRSGLAVLTSGTLPPNPAELLQSQAMRQVLDKVRREYDVIVIDTPPLLPVTDAALLATQADGAVVVVRQGKTTRDQLTHSMERLHAVGARPLGVTLNMVRAASRRSGGYGYRYGHTYAPGKGWWKARKQRKQAEAAS
jgi:capsular exopolysaccharide synthesis family protein